MKVKNLVFGVLCLCAAMGLHAGTVSLQPDEIVRLRSLIATNAAAAKQFSIVQRTATAALGDTPDPIVKVVTEGHLDKDPLKIRTEESLGDMEKSNRWPGLGR